MKQCRRGGGGTRNVSTPDAESELVRPMRTLEHRTTRGLDVSFLLKGNINRLLRPDPPRVSDCGRQGCWLVGGELLAAECVGWYGLVGRYWTMRELRLAAAKLFAFFCFFLVKVPLGNPGQMNRKMTIQKK
jgi:hypothetical protein